MHAAVGGGVGRRGTVGRAAGRTRRANATGAGAATRRRGLVPPTVRDPPAHGGCRVQVGSSQVTPITRGPPWVPITGPMWPTRICVARVLRREEVEHLLHLGGEPVGDAQVLDRRRASATLSRSTSRAFLRVRGLPASSTLPRRDVDDGLDRQQRAEQRLGAADAAALLEVVEGVERADDVGAARRGCSTSATTSSADAPPARGLGREQHLGAEARGDRARVDDPHVEVALDGALAAFWADCMVADRSEDRLMHTTASAPAACLAPEGGLELARAPAPRSRGARRWPASFS